MEEKKVSTLFEEMRDDVSKYITSSLELGKLEVYEKVSLGTAAVSYALIVAGIILIAFFFALVAIALFLGELLQNSWMGFGIVAAFSILVLLITLLFRKYCKKKFANRTIRFLMAFDNDKEDKTNDK